jgi:hypothetical protein
MSIVWIAGTVAAVIGVMLVIHVVSLVLEEWLR